MTKGTIELLLSFPINFPLVLVCILILTLVLLAAMSDTVSKPDTELLIERKFKVRGMRYSDLVWVNLGNGRIFIIDQDDGAGTVPISMFTQDATVESRRIGPMLHRGVNVPYSPIIRDTIIYPINEGFLVSMHNNVITSRRLPLWISDNNAHVRERN